MGTGEVKAESRLDAEAERLREELAYHEHRAKVLESPLISASRLRALVEDLKRLEAIGARRTQDALTRRAPGPARASFVRRPVPGTWPEPAGIATERALHGYYESQVAEDPRRGVVVGSAWLLGVDVVLTYRDGFFESAVLIPPGGGSEGLEVTENLRTLGSVPLRLRRAGTTTESRITRLTRQALGPSTSTPVPPAPDSLLVRGIVTMRISDALALDRRRVDSGLPPFVDPAAAITSSLQCLDPAVTSARPLVFFADDASWTTDGIETHWQLLGALKSWGFGVGALHFRASSMMEVLDFVRALKDERPSFDFPIEGGVLTLNARVLAASSDSPRRARLEFQTRGHEARLERVYHAVGRSGAIFAVGLLERAGGPAETVPIPARPPPLPLTLVEGQPVRVVAGAIAPRILLGPESRTRDHPATCPACSTTLVRAVDAHFLRCPDPSCPGRRRARLLHVVGPRGLNLGSFDVGLVDRILLDGGPDDLLGLLALDAERVEASSPGRGARFAAELAALTSISLWQAIYLAALDEVGERSARLLASMGGSAAGLEALATLPFRPDLVEPAAWRSFVAWMKGAGPEFLRGIARRGLRVKGEDEVFSSPFAGKRVLVLGRATSFAPGLLVDLLERRGAILDARPSRRTDLVVRGEGASKELRSMALHYGVPEVEEATLHQLLSRAELR